MDMEDSEAPRATSRNGAAIDGKRKWSGSSEEDIKHGEKKLANTKCSFFNLIFPLDFPSFVSNAISYDANVHKLFA